MGATVFGAAVGIVAALNGCGAWAIIVQQLTSRGRRPCSSGSPPAGARASSSRSRACATSAATARTCSARGSSSTSNRNLDNLLIGRFLGPAALGAYAVSYNVMLTPMTRSRCRCRRSCSRRCRACRTSARRCGRRGCAPPARRRDHDPGDAAGCRGGAGVRRGRAGAEVGQAVPCSRCSRGSGLLQSLQGLNGDDAAAPGSHDARCSATRSSARGERRTRSSPASVGRRRGRRPPTRSPRR